jgi:hypothetical protein
MMAAVSGSATAAPADVNGAAMAAVLGAGIGSFAVAFFVLLNEAGLFVAPALYGPAGGVTGRTACAAIVWLVAWAVLHARWRTREIAPGRVFALALLLVAAGAVGTFPPFWGLL